MNSSLKVNIFFDFQDGPWGGGNQFFKTLRKEFRALGIYEEDVEKANCVLFYSYQKLNKVIELKKKYPDKFFIHRLGTVLQYHRGGQWKIMDKMIVWTANELADKVIFISEWLRQELTRLGFNNKNHQVIVNAADGSIFNQNGQRTFDPKKIKLITTSWSTNKNKGFDIYKYLDDSLDFSKYEMTFVGNAPVSFKKIKTLAPRPSEQLAEELRKNDIYISATRYDAYPNSIVEALACGLPVVAIKNGGNPEIISAGGGELFDGEKNILNIIDKVAGNYEHYQKQIKHPTAREITLQYETEMIKLAQRKPRKMSAVLPLKIKCGQIIFNYLQKYAMLINKLKNIKRASYRYYKYTWHRNLLEKFLLQHSALMQDKILDIGSKSRRYDQLFKGEVTAVDIEPNEKYDIKYGDAQNLAFEPASFDGVLCLETLSYVEDIKKAVGEIHRMLKDNGWTITSIPFMQHDHGDRIRLTKTFAKELFKGAGFSEINVISYGNGHIAVWDIAKKKLTLDKPYLQRKLAFYFILLPWLLILKIFKLDKVQDKYYTGLFITAKK